MSENEAALPVKAPSLFRNYMSFIGAAIAIASLASIALLFLIELSGRTENPYLGIFTYILFPAVLMAGIGIMILGAIIERRRRRLNPAHEIASYPKLDLNDPRARRGFFIFLLVTFLFVSASAFGSYRAYEFTESVTFCGATCHTPMKPQYVAHQASSHARVPCVACHVGPGAGWYIKSKFNGAYQLYSVAFNKFPRPIKTPIHNLRPADQICEQCHWAEKFYGAQLKVINHYSYDQNNTMRQTRMLINVGGGSPATGPVAGIHWHMNIANEVTYIHTDEQRQIIPWIRVKDRSGKVTEYMDRNRPLTAERIQAAEKRRMDCVDCHNRPAHVYLPPDMAVDQSFAAGRLDPSLPYLKSQAIEALGQTYQTNDEAVKAISSRVDQFYRTNYADIYASKGETIKANIAELQRIYQTYIFPEMKVDWQTHPDNIGHFYSSGCFRCHDGEHVSNTGKVIRNDCNICHTVISDSANPSAKLRTESFKHPVDLGGLADRKCESCHKSNGPFQHPINLGDISSFQCVECHPRKNDAGVKVPAT